MYASRQAVMENVRRYRAIASLYRQTAAFRPLQRWSLLAQAEEWERLAVEELEAYFDEQDVGADDVPPRVVWRAHSRGDMLMAA